MAENDANIEWRWGARADAEIGERAIADFMADIYGGSQGETARAAGKRRGNANDEAGPSNGGTQQVGATFLNEIARAAGAPNVNGLQNAEDLKYARYN